MQSRRTLVLEALAVSAAAVASVWSPVAALIGLVVAGSLARWSRGRGWSEPGVAVPGLALAGAAIGLVALAAAVVVATPLLEDLTRRAVDWTDLTVVRGNPTLAASAALLVAARAVATELVMRRWILERVHDLGARDGVAIACAALVEAATCGGHGAARIGAGIVGVGLGLLYVGAGRRLAPAIACRVAFDVGALALVAMRVL